MGRSSAPPPRSSNGDEGSEIERPAALFGGDADSSGIATPKMTLVEDQSELEESNCGREEEKVEVQPCRKERDCFFFYNSFFFHVEFEEPFLSSLFPFSFNFFSLSRSLVTPQNPTTIRNKAKRKKKSRKFSKVRELSLLCAAEAGNTAPTAVSTAPASASASVAAPRCQSRKVVKVARVILGPAASVRHDRRRRQHHRRSKSGR